MKLHHQLVLAGITRIKRLTSENVEPTSVSAPVSKLLKNKVNRHTVCSLGVGRFILDIRLTPFLLQCLDLSMHLKHGCGDSHFGPGLNSVCRGSFDFTGMLLELIPDLATILILYLALFESSILELLPAACFLFLAPLRIWQLSRRRNELMRSNIHTLKLVTKLHYNGQTNLF